MRRLDFYGANAAAYNSREPEVLLAGAAGTGKSLALLAKCLTLLDKYPGARVLFLRGTRASLTQSGLVSWEDKVLGPRHPLLTRRPVTRRVRQSYEFPNGSEFVVGGLDDPGKTLSAEYDAVYIQEATEEGVTLAKYETLLRSLRNGRTPFTQLMTDCNPTTPAHWLYRRHLAGGLRLFSSTHRDNPAYWDRAAQEWTPAGRDYLATLNRYTGARRNRFLKGLWVAAEGLVYDGYDPAVHLLPAGWLPPSHWRRVWSIDWGFRDPLVVLFWAIDEDGRMHLYREFYRSNVRVESVARWCADLVRSGTEPRPSLVVADHDPENSATFTEHAGVYCQPADKTDRDRGLQETQGRFDRGPDGRPRIFFRPDSRCHAADTVLEGEGRPTSLLEEIVGYVWKKADPERPKDEPIEVNDHAMDAMRYAVRACPLPRPGGGTLYAGPPAATPEDL